jgi:hypothetical protein
MALVVGLAVMLTAGPVPAQQPGPAATPFKPEELEQIAAPIALYPDPLLAQIFMASTYPLEIVQAARLVKEQPNLKGDALNQELQKQPWDDSVKSLVTFPQVLSMMNEKLDWTQRLGDAFLAQQAGLMEAVQRLRAKAQAQGTLKDTKEQKVVVEVVTPPPGAAPPAAPAPSAPPPPTVIKIEPTDPQVVYVPTYNPTVVYGGWPYPAYPPYAYYPPGYVAGAAFFSFAAGVAVGGAIWGNCDWNGGDVNINNNQYNNFTKNVNKSDVAAKRSEIQSKRGSGQAGKWEHNPEHRKGVQYRDQGTQQRFNKGDLPNAQSREAFRGRAEQGRTDLARGQGGPGDRGQGGPGDRGQGGPGDRGQGGPGDRGQGGPGDRGQGGPGDRGQGGISGRGDGGGVGRGDAAGGARGAGVQQTRGGGAFDGLGSGSQTRRFSDRGSASRQAGATSRSGGGGGARSGGGGGARGGGRR